MKHLHFAYSPHSERNADETENCIANNELQKCSFSFNVLSPEYPPDNLNQKYRMKNEDSDVSAFKSPLNTNLTYMNDMKNYIKNLNKQGEVNC